MNKILKFTALGLGATAATILGVRAVKKTKKEPVQNKLENKDEKETIVLFDMRNNKEVFLRDVKKHGKNRVKELIKEDYNTYLISGWIELISEAAISHAFDSLPYHYDIVKCFLYKLTADWHLVLGEKEIFLDELESSTIIQRKYFEEFVNRLIEIGLLCVRNKVAIPDECSDSYINGDNILFLSFKGNKKELVDKI